VPIPLKHIALRDEESYNDILTPSFEGVFCCIIKQETEKAYLYFISTAYGLNLHKTIDFYV
jgi:hypothetical protein